MVTATSITRYSVLVFLLAKVSNSPADQAVWVSNKVTVGASVLPVDSESRNESVLAVEFFFRISKGRFLLAVFQMCFCIYANKNDYGPVMSACMFVLFNHLTDLNRILRMFS